MKSTSLAFAGFVTVVLAGGISAQDSSSAMEFFDASGAQTTAKVGWSGTAANGHVFIETPSDGEGVKVKQGVITAQGFVGDGSGLTNLPQTSVAVNDVVGLQSALDGKATATQVGGQIKDSLANHTATVTISGVTGLQSALDGKTTTTQVAAQVKDSLARIDQALAGKPSVAQVAGQISDSLASHSTNVAISDVVGLQSALNGKADASHSHSGFLKSVTFETAVFMTPAAGSSAMDIACPVQIGNLVGALVYWKTSTTATAAYRPVQIGIPTANEPAFVSFWPSTKKVTVWQATSPNSMAMFKIVWLYID